MRELNIDLIDSINPFGTAYAIMAKSLGELQADVNEDQMLFEIHGLILALHYEARFLKNPGSIAKALAGFDNILTRFSAQAPQAGPSPVSTQTTKE